MKVIKRLTVLISVVVLLSTSFISSSAVGDVDYDELIYDSEGNVIGWYDFSPEVDYVNQFAVNMLAAVEPNYPGWNPSKIPWSSFPSHIRNIAFSFMHNITLHPDYRLTPFIMVRVSSSNYEIFAGYNVFLLCNDYRSVARICGHNDWNSVLYHATFSRSDNSVVNAWEEVIDLTYFESSSSPNIFYFNNCYINFDSTRDFYLYGSNHNNHLNSATSYYGSQNYLYSSNTSDIYKGYFYHAGLGVFHSGASNNMISYLSSRIPNAYFQHFTPQGSAGYTVKGVNDFGLTDGIISSSNFLMLDDLPYGEDTLVISYTISPSATYHFFADENDDVKLISRYNPSLPNQVQVGIFTKKPLYRIGYSLKNNAVVSCDGVIGLAKCTNKGGGLSNPTNPSDKVYRYYSDQGYTAYWYTLIEGNVTCTISKNNLNVTVIEDGIFKYGIGSYPSLQSAELDTQKGIWATLKEIPDKIGAFFDSLKNYLLYFQETEPEHVNPFAGILTDVQNFFDSQIDDTAEFKESLNSTFENVSSYISTGSSVINKLLEGVPLLNAFLIFFVVIAVIRKVVGR